MTNDNDLDCNDLTQLSSREQLSALMDSALPADQTRFLLRRLQHDASLAECWDRWRITGEAMRGLAPAQRLPADFAARVAAALHADAAAPIAAARQPGRAPAWRRWGGGAAVAASLAVVALMVRPDAVEAPAASQVAAVAAPTQAPVSDPPVPAPQPVQTPAIEAGTQLAAAASVAAVSSARPQRTARSGARRAVAAQRETGRPVASETARVASAEPAAVRAPQPDIVTRPWPRSVLPQYATGGFTVGFGEQAHSAPYNPFQAKVRIEGFPARAPASEQASPDHSAPADTARPEAPQAAEQP